MHVMKKYIHALVATVSMVFLATTATAGLADLFPAQLENAQGEAVSRDDALQGKLIGVYFSAQWCPPCRGFTPSLVEFRNKHKDQFEVVFVSSDRSPADHRKYMSEYKMDFVTVAHRSEAAQALAQRYSVRGIPMLVILDQQGNVITTDGRGELSRDAQAALANWKKQASL
jgi:nucleoredoxin